MLTSRLVLTLALGLAHVHGAGGGRCLRRLPAHQRLRGRIEREVHLGPPGYGETPARDRKDTIAVLVPDPPIVVCGDSAGAPSARAGRIQLLDVPHLVLGSVGTVVTVYGGLDERTFGWHFTPFVLFVDSIPALRGGYPEPQSRLPASSADSARSVRAAALDLGGDACASASSAPATSAARSPGASARSGTTWRSRTRAARRRCATSRGRPARAP